MAPTKSTKPAAKLPAKPQKASAKASGKVSTKATAAPARTPARPRPQQRSPLTKKELDELRERLLAERVELEEQLATLEENTFAASQSDMSGEVAFDDETADAGTATFERERDLSIENNVRDLLAKIDRAVRRMDAGTYGLCDRCGKPIEKARIKALPYVDLCIKDAQAQSRR
jgi:RNA polymerase-binding protein DksA